MAREKVKGRKRHIITDRLGFLILARMVVIALRYALASIWSRKSL